MAIENSTYSFEVRGKVYTLRYDFNAICDIEEKAGVGLTALVGGERVGFNTIRLIVWGGLKWKLAGLTKEAVGNLIKNFVDDGGSLEELTTKAITLLGNSQNATTIKESTQDMGNTQTED